MIFTVILTEVLVLLGTGDFTVTKFGSSNVHLTRVNGADFTLHAQAPEDNLIAIKGSVVDFTDPSF